MAREGADHERAPKILRCLYSLRVASHASLRWVALLEHLAEFVSAPVAWPDRELVERNKCALAVHRDFVTRFAPVHHTRASRRNQDATRVCKSFSGGVRRGWTGWWWHAHIPPSGARV
jgi:hypothetical protein